MGITTGSTGLAGSATVVSGTTGGFFDRKTVGKAPTAIFIL